MAEVQTSETLPSPSRLAFRAGRAVLLGWVAACILSISLMILAVDQVASIFGIAEGGRTGIFAHLHKMGVAMARTAWGDVCALWSAAVSAARPVLADGRAALHARGWLR